MMQQKKFSKNKLITGLIVEIIFVCVGLFLSISYGSKNIPLTDVISFFQVT